MVLRRAKNKFPGRQSVVVSSKWGFTKYEKTRFQQLRKEGKLVNDGLNVKTFTEHGSLSKHPLFQEKHEK